MLFNFLVLLVFILATAYFSTQGLLSSVLALITAAFASILAMGLFEPLQGMIGSHWPGLARGVTFLTLFLVLFTALRFAADMAVPKNIKLKKIIDNVGGGVIGFFASLVIVGTSVLGLEMLPLHTTLLGMGGDQEYPNDSRMQGAEPGQVNPDEGISTLPQRFTLALWHGASGRGLGLGLGLGDPHPTWVTGFNSVHPDLVQESYGYRNVSQYGSNAALPKDLLKVKAAFVSDAAPLFQKCKITNTAGKQLAVVRIEIAKGTTAPETSSDTDDKFRITPTQVRLGTDRPSGEKAQHYPIGHLSGGNVFEAMPLDTGHLVDDYPKGNIYQEWVFLLDKEETPRFIEVKQLACVAVDKVQDKPFTPLAAAEYPQQPWKKEIGTIAVTVTGDSGPLPDRDLILVPVSVQVKKIDAEKTRANSHLEDVLDKSKEGVEPWASALGKPGISSRQEFFAAHNTVTNIGNDNTIQVNQLMPVFMLGAVEANGSTNHNAVPAHFKDIMAKKLFDVRETVKTDNNGKAMLKDIAPGSYCIISDGTTDSGAYYVWAVTAQVDKKQDVILELKPSNACFTLTPVK